MSVPHDTAGRPKPPAPDDAPRPRHRRRRRRKKKKRFSIPAGLVFYVTAGVTALSTALVYLRGQRFLVASVAACVLTVAVLIIDERTGFTNSRRLRRSGEHRVKFNKVEVTVLFVLLMIAVYMSILAWAD